jgi:peptide/nickel transport system substrate-binding protein
VSTARAQTRTQLTVGVTDNVNSYNPVADSAAFMASVWCQVYGCLITYDYQVAAYKGMLVERWEVIDPTTWVFHLRRDVKSHDGQPLTAADVLFSIDRMKNDRASAKRAQVAPLKTVEAIDQHTVRMVTSEPTADLLEYLTDHTLVMQKRLIEAHGDREADRNHPCGFGPYRLKELVIGSHVVLEKNPARATSRPEIRTRSYTASCASRSSGSRLCSMAKSRSLSSYRRTSHPASKRQPGIMS